MTFHNVRLSECVEQGFTGGPAGNTLVKAMTMCWAGKGLMNSMRGPAIRNPDSLESMSMSRTFYSMTTATRTAMDCSTATPANRLGVWKTPD